MKGINGRGEGLLSFSWRCHKISLCSAGLVPPLCYIFQWNECGSIAHMRRITGVKTWKLVSKLRKCSGFQALKILQISLGGYTVMKSVLIWKCELYCKSKSSSEIENTLIEATLSGTPNPWLGLAAVIPVSQCTIPTLVMESNFELEDESNPYLQLHPVTIVHRKCVIIKIQLGQVLQVFPTWL